MYVWWLDQYISVYAFDVGEGYRLAVMAWSDNLYAFGPTVEDALRILSDWADAMYACAGYEIKPDSLEVGGGPSPKR